MCELKHLQNHVSTQQQNILRGSEVGIPPAGVVYASLNSHMKAENEHFDSFISAPWNLKYRRHDLLLRQCKLLNL